MELAAIATTCHLERLVAYIGTDLASSVTDVRVHGTKIASLGVASVTCPAVLPEERQRVLSIVARSAARFAVHVLEGETMIRILERRYGVVGPEARRRVLARAGRYLCLHGCAPEVERDARVEWVAPVLLAQLEAEGVLILEGALRFRLPQYLAALEDAVGQAVDDHLLEREHVEFIHLLRSFVAAQPPRTDRVHLVVDGARVRLFDREGRPMPLEAEPVQALGSLEDALNYEDVLISALIAAAPTRIVVHPRAGAASHHVDGVRRVFEARVERCGPAGCALCPGA